jgi:hypothetical protein
MYIYIWYKMVHLEKSSYQYVMVKTKSFCYKFVKMNKEIHILFLCRDHYNYKPICFCSVDIENRRLVELLPTT